MVHVVKVVNIVHATLMPAPQSQRWSLRPTLDLDRDKFRCFRENMLTRSYIIQIENPYTSLWLWLTNRWLKLVTMY